MLIKYSRKGHVHTLSTGGPALGDIVIDNSAIPEAQRAGVAKQLLGAAVAYCYGSALAGAMEARGVEYAGLQVEAELELGPNEMGQGRVRRIVVRGRPAIAEDDAEGFERVKKVMRQGCLVTGSLHDGIEMVYDLEADINS